MAFELTKDSPEKRTLFLPIETEIKKRQLDLDSSKVELEAHQLAIDELVHYAKGIAKEISFSKRENLSIDVDDINLTLLSGDDKIWLVIKKGDQMLMFTGWDLDELKEVK